MSDSPDTPIFGSTDELMLGVLRKFFFGQGVEIGTLYSEDITPPFIMVRRERRSGTVMTKTDDDRFLQPSIVAVNTITDGIDADEVAEELHEAIRYAIRKAQQDQVVIPNGGCIAQLENSTTASRVSDWATSTGVVQYASMPKHWVRYEAIYRVLVRPPGQDTITNRFISRHLGGETLQEE